MSEAIAAKLEKACALIEKGWCQIPEATKADGGATSHDDPEATCFCTFGAICLVAGYPSDLQRELMGRIKKVVGAHPISWNDKPGRTQAEVVDAFKKAAELARGLK